MGYTSHSVENLGPPFLLVDEVVFVIPKAGRLRLSKHHFKLLFILRGEIEHEIEGLEGRQPLAPGDILVAPVVGRHHYINRNPHEAIPVQAIRMFLDDAWLKQNASGRFLRPETDFGDYVMHHLDHVAHLRGGIDNEITQLIDALRKETEHRALGYRHRVRSICVDLVVAVSRRLKAGRSVSQASRASNAPQIVVAAKEFILKHFARDLRLRDIAWHVRKGEEHLARVFMRETGQSVFDYVREMRIHNAKTLLQNPSLSLTAIARQCGFHSLSFFSRTFRQEVGLPPSHYRGHTSATPQALPQSAAS